MCAVYVDDMYRYPMGNYRRMKMSHMIADTEAELHHMAGRLGISQKWFQGDHYDIGLMKRKEALRYGAVEVSLKQMSALRWCKRQKRGYNSPAHALDQMRIHIKRMVSGGGYDSRKEKAK